MVVLENYAKLSKNRVIFNRGNKKPAHYCCAVMEKCIILPHY